MDGKGQCYKISLCLLMILSTVNSKPFRYISSDDQDEVMARNMRARSGFYKKHNQPFSRRYANEWTRNADQPGVDLNVDIGTGLPSPPDLNSMDDEIQKQFVNALKDHNDITSEKFVTSCPKCHREEVEIQEVKPMINPKPQHLTVKAPYPCDDWNEKLRVCWFDRNVGDTLTLHLDFSIPGQKIIWNQEFHTFRSNIQKHIVINPNNPPWNIVIGSEGQELRLSPITEVDLDFNAFTATVLSGDNAYSTGSALNKVTFRIRVVPEDLGFVYEGEALQINLYSFVSLPMESLTFLWFLEKYGEHSTLPSNMRVSSSGSSVAIAELRKEQEGILSCSVYTNKGIFITRKRFLVQELDNEIPIEIDEVEGQNPNHPKRTIREANLEDFDKDISEGLSENDNMENELENESPERDNSLQKIQDDNSINDAILNEDYINNPSQEDSNAFLDADQESLPQHQQISNKLKPQKTHMEPPISHVHVHEHPHKQQLGEGEEPGFIVDVVRRPDNQEVEAEDKVSKLLSFCHHDFECSGRASCIQKDEEARGFCRCLRHYHGNGLFCWEDTNLRFDMDTYFNEMMHHSKFSEIPTPRNHNIHKPKMHKNKHKFIDENPDLL